MSAQTLALGVDFTRTYSGSEEVESGFTLGSRAQDDAGNVYVFIRAQGAISAYDVIEMDSGYDCPPLSGAGVATFVAQTAIADNYYGWVLAQGVGSAAAASAVAADDQLARLTNGSGQLVTAAAATGATFAIATAADTANVAPIYIF